MKIAIIHQYYLMPGQSGGARFNEMARMWSERGHEVTIVAGTVDYGSGKAPERYRGKWVTTERDGAVTVYRCHVPASYSRGFLGRKWAFLGFTLSASTAALMIPRPDIVIATSPPLIAVIPGWLAARFRFRPVPWIFEMRDLWPESAVTTGVLKAKSLLTRILYLLEKWAASSATAVNVLTPAFRDDLLERGLAPAEKIHFVPNGADIELFEPGPADDQLRRTLGWEGKFVAMYAGAHGLANAVGQLVNAAALLRDRSDILIACVGDGPKRQELEAEAAARGLDNIRFYGAQPKTAMPALVRACDVGLAVLQNNPTFRTVYPNKVFDYMSCAKPSLLAIDGIARKLVCDEAQAGVFAEPENASAIAEAIRNLADSPEACARMGNSGRSWVLENASRRGLAERYLGIMLSLKAGSQATSRAE